MNGAAMMLITFLIAGSWLIVYDVWLVKKGGYEATESNQVLRFAQRNPIAALLAGMIIGLLCGHLFWPQPTLLP